MKNKTLLLFFALAFSFFGTTASAQFQYEPQTYWASPGGVQKWAKLMSPTIGASMYTVMKYTSVDTLRKVTYYNLGGSIPGNTTWQVWSSAVDTILPGNHISDTTKLVNGQGPEELVPNGGNGWGVQVRFYPMNSWTPVSIHTFAFGQINPTVPPLATIQDPLDYSCCTMTGTATVQSNYFPDPGNAGGVFLQKIYASLDKPDGSTEVYPPNGYTFPTGIQPIAHFSLDPFEPSGEYCVRWWITSEHLSNSPKYWVGEMTVWEREYCFTFGDITTSVEDVLDQGLIAFPNPTNDGAVSIASDEAMAYMIFNSVGQLVSTGLINIGDNRLDDLSRFPSGHYILKTSSGLTTRLEKQ